MIKKEVDKRLTKKVDNTLKNLQLTKTEKDILHLLSDEFLTIKQICIRRQCSRQAVYKILKKLQEKGAYDSAFRRLTKSDPPVNLVNQNLLKIRLHGQEFNIRILWQDHKYQQLLSRSNIIYIDGNTIRLYKNSIEIYSGQAFFGENEQQSTSKSLAYWMRFFTRLEHDLKIIIIKQRSANIKLVNQHYARTDSEISESAIERGEKIRIYAQEDGKLAFITDDSFGFKEDETVHPITAKQDRKAVDKQVNDWRIHNPPTNSELAISIQDVTKNQMLFAENMKSHIKAVKDLGNGVTKFNEKIDLLIERLKKKDI